MLEPRAHPRDSLSSTPGRALRTSQERHGRRAHAGSRPRHRGARFRLPPGDAEALYAVGRRWSDRGAAGGPAGPRLPGAAPRSGRGRLRVPATRGPGAAAQGHGQGGSRQDPERDGAGRPHRAAGRAAGDRDPAAAPASHPGRALGGHQAARLPRGQHRAAPHAGLRPRQAGLDHGLRARPHSALRPRQRDALDRVRHRRPGAAHRRDPHPEDPAPPARHASGRRHGPARHRAQGRGRPGVGDLPVPARGPRRPPRHGLQRHADRDRHRRRRPGRGPDCRYPHAAAVRRVGGAGGAVSRDAVPVHGAAAGELADRALPGRNADGHAASGSSRRRSSGRSSSPSSCR